MLTGEIPPEKLVQLSAAELASKVCNSSFSFFKFQITGSLHFSSCDLAVLLEMILNHVGPMFG